MKTKLKHKLSLPAEKCHSQLFRRFFVFLLLIISLMGCKNTPIELRMVEGRQAPEEEFIYQPPVEKFKDPYLVLVNKEHPVTKEVDPTSDECLLGELVSISAVAGAAAEIKLEARAAEALIKMMKKMKGQGITNIWVSSGWRSKARQRTLFEEFEKREQQGISNLAREYFGNEYLFASYFSIGQERLTPEDARLVANYYSAYPGQSEHHTGLCVDFYANGLVNQSDFANTAAFEWLSQNAAEYGFILRYPNGKEKITGYCYEPWHFRYVGVSAAREIEKFGVTLEEYHGKCLFEGD